LVVFFQFIAFLGNAALRGAGDTVTPLWLGVLVNVVNFGINVNLIFGNAFVPRLGVPGAAIGTSISYVIGALTLMALLLWGKHRLKLHLSGGWVHMDAVRRIFRIGWPAALEQILLQVAFLLWVGMVVVFGTQILAAHQIGLRIQSFAFMPGFGFAIAATALVGQNLGARDAVAAERSGWEATKFSVAVMSVIAIVIFLLAEPIARGFIGDPVVVSWSVTGVVKPVQVRRPNRAVTLTTSLDVFVDLPPDQKGSHLSRNLEAINEVVDRSVREPVESLEELVDTIARSLLKRHDYATTSEVWATADYFLERTSPWGRTSLEPYRLVARANARRGEREVERSIGVEVVGMTACP